MERYVALYLRIKRFIYFVDMVIGVSLSKYKDLHIGVIISKNLRIVPRAKHIEVCLAPIPEFGFLATPKELCQDLKSMRRDVSRHIEPISFESPIRDVARFFTYEIISRIGFPSAKVEMIEPDRFEVMLRRAISTIISSSCDTSNADPSYVLYVDGGIKIYPAVKIGKSVATLVPMVISEEIAEKILSATFFFDLERALRQQLLNMDLIHVLHILHRPASTSSLERVLRERPLPREELEKLLQVFNIARKLSQIKEWFKHTIEINRGISTIVDALKSITSVVLFGRCSLIKYISSKICSLLDLLDFDLYKGYLTPKTIEGIEAVAKMLKDIGIEVRKPKKIRNLETALRTTMEMIMNFASFLTKLFKNGYFIATKNSIGERVVLRFLTALSNLADSGLPINPNDLKYSVIIVAPESIYVEVSTSPINFIDAVIDYRNGVADIVCTGKAYRQYIASLIQRLIHPKEVREVKDRIVIEFEPSPENVEKLCAALATMMSFDARWEEISLEAQNAAEKLINENPEKALEIISREIGVSLDELKRYAKKIALIMSSATLEEYEKWFKNEVVETSISVSRELETLSNILSKYLSKVRQGSR